MEIYSLDINIIFKIELIENINTSLLISKITKTV